MKRIFAILFAALLICTGCTAQTPSGAASLEESSVSSVSSVSSSAPEVFDQPPENREELPFEQMKYVQPDLDETIAQYEDFARRVRNAKSSGEVMAVWKEEAQLCKDYYNMYTLSNVLFSLDTTNEENAANYQYMQDFIAKLKPAAVSLTRSILQSPYRSQIGDIVGAHVLDAMEIDTKNYSEEQLELELQ